MNHPTRNETKARAGRKGVPVTCPDCGTSKVTSRDCVRRAYGGQWRCQSCAAKARIARDVPQAVRDRARLLRSRGYKPSEIAAHLRDENVSVSVRAVDHWTATA